jgi:hypothetical protein
MIMTQATSALRFSFDCEAGIGIEGVPIKETLFEIRPGRFQCSYSIGLQTMNAVVFDPPEGRQSGWDLEVGLFHALMGSGNAGLMLESTCQRPFWRLRNTEYPLAGLPVARWLAYQQCGQHFERDRVDDSCRFLEPRRVR